MSFSLPLGSTLRLFTRNVSLHMPARCKLFAWPNSSQLSQPHLRDNASIFIVDGAAGSAFATIFSNVVMEHAASVHVYHTTEVTDPATTVLPKTINSK